jgi:hypothetical protein
VTDQIRAPWTPEQVAALNRFQREGGMHPFTCGGEHAPGSPVLVARIDGWHCSDPYGEGCDYRQDWAHPFMADPDAWPQRPASAPVPAQDTPGGPGRQPDATEAPQTSVEGFAPCRTTQHCAYHGWCHRCDPAFAAVMSRVNVAIQRNDANDSHWGPLYEAVGQALRDVGEQPARTTPDNSATSGDTVDNSLRERLATVLSTLTVLGGAPPARLVPVIRWGAGEVTRIVDWRPLDTLLDALLAVRDRELERLKKLHQAHLRVEARLAGGSLVAEAAVERVRLLIGAYRKRLQLADPILLGKLDRVLEQPAELEAAAGERS